MVYFEESLLQSALRTAGILPALLFALHLHPAWCAQARTSSLPQIAAIISPN